MYWVSFDVDGNFSCVTFNRRKEQEAFLSNLLAIFGDEAQKAVVKSWSNTTREEIYIRELKHKTEV